MEHKQRSLEKSLKTTGSSASSKALRPATSDAMVGSSGSLSARSAISAVLCRGGCDTTRLQLGGENVVTFEESVSDEAFLDDPIYKPCY